MQDSRSNKTEWWCLSCMCFYTTRDVGSSVNVIRISAWSELHSISQWHRLLHCICWHSRSTSSLRIVVCHRPSSSSSSSSSSVIICVSSSSSMYRPGSPIVAIEPTRFIEKTRPSSIREHRSFLTHLHRVRVGTYFIISRCTRSDSLVVLRIDVSRTLEFVIDDEEHSRATYIAWHTSLWYSNKYVSSHRSDLRQQAQSSTVADDGAHSIYRDRQLYLKSTNMYCWTHRWRMVMWVDGTMQHNVIANRYCRTQLKLQLLLVLSSWYWSRQRNHRRRSCSIHRQSLRISPAASRHNNSHAKTGCMHQCIVIIIIVIIVIRIIIIIKIINTSFICRLSSVCLNERLSVSRSALIDAAQSIIHSKFDRMRAASNARCCVLAPTTAIFRIDAVTVRDVSLCIEGGESQCRRWSLTRAAVWQDRCMGRNIEVIQGIEMRIYDSGRWISNDGADADHLHVHASWWQ